MRNTKFVLIKSFIFVMISFILISCCFGDSIETDSYYVINFDDPPKEFFPLPYQKRLFKGQAGPIEMTDRPLKQGQDTGKVFWDVYINAIIQKSLISDRTHQGDFLWSGGSVFFFPAGKYHLCGDVFFYDTDPSSPKFSQSWNNIEIKGQGSASKFLGEGNGKRIYITGYCGKGRYPSGPFRGHKSDAWEGGHRIPFIIKWPNVVKDGTICDQLVSQADIIATFAEIIGAKLPENAGEDGFSLMPLLQGGTGSIREYDISQSLEGYMAIRKGNWKLIAGPGGGGNWSYYSAEPKITTPAQLCDLENDIAEKQNLYHQKPEIVAEMLDILEKLVNDGRSTPGTLQKNDVPVDWQRFMNAFRDNGIY